MESIEEEGQQLLRVLLLVSGKLRSELSEGGLEASGGHAAELTTPARA